MYNDHLSETEANLIVEKLRNHDLLRDDAEVFADANASNAGYHVSVISKMRESKLQGKTASEQQDMQDAAISAARQLATLVFKEIIGRRPLESELMVASFIRHILDCRINIRS